MVHIFHDKPSILGNYISEIRDKSIQKDPLRFRMNMERIAECMAFEISKHLNYSKKEITTPLGNATEFVLEDQIVLGTILRAGMVTHNGLLRVFDRSESAFISAYRDESNNEIKIVSKYIAAPNLDNKVLILSDPMLATGASMVVAYNAILKHGTPKSVHILSVVGSKQGLDKIKAELPEDTNIWIAALDENLNDKAYIVPGLGDAGDLSYGMKLEHAD